MLSPEYLLRVSEGGEKIAESLHNDIISKIVDRIAVRLDRGDDYILTAQDKWQIEVLQESGMLLEDIQKLLAQSTGLMQKEIAEAMAVIARQNRMTVEQLKPYFSPEFEAAVERSVLTTKVMGLIRDNAVIS